ncbi:MAG: alpha-L-rhamnosidase, partial [Mucilaginibacter sp.]|nr:alpha-L-rhamnosidase [Mucilaginibacter sp.]
MRSNNLRYAAKMQSSIKLYLKTGTLIVLLFFSVTTYAQTLSVKDLVCEYRTNPVGIDILKPRLSWKLSSTATAVMQSAYEIRVTIGENAAGRNKALWKTGKIASDQSVNVEYNGPALTSRERCYWQVRVWDNKGNVSAWSDYNYWEMGLLHPQDWTAKWIISNNPADTVDGPNPILRTSFLLNKPVKSARLYITAHGIFEAYLNGHRISADYFAPGWTSYNKRLQYETYDVTSLLKTGKNAGGASLGDGWYRGHLDKWKNIYGKDLALLFQLEITFTDGTKTAIGSDGKWKSANGPVMSSSFYNGEIYDARLERTGWNLSDYDDSKWRSVGIINEEYKNLVAPVINEIRKHEVFHPLKVIITPQKDTVIDFGQNLV